MVTRTQVLERHIRALGRAKAILKNHHWGKGVASAAGAITTSVVDAVPKGEGRAKKSKGKGGRSNKAPVPGNTAAREDPASFLNRALYSLNLADLTLTDPTANVKLSATGEDILDNLTSTVRALEWRNNMACGRVQRLTQLTSQFNATGRTLHASNLTQVHRFVALLKTAQSVADARKGQTANAAASSEMEEASTGFSSSSSPSSSSSSSSDTTAAKAEVTGPQRYRSKTLKDFARKGHRKKEDEQRALTAELASVLQLSDAQVIAIGKLGERVAERELSLQMLGKSFRAVRDLASVVCDLQHKCNAAMRHLLLPAQLESFLKAIYTVREAVGQMDPLQNETKEGKDGGVAGAGVAGAGAGGRVSAGREGEAVPGGGSAGGNKGRSAALWGVHDDAVRRQVSKHRRRVAERDLANASVVGIDSESGLSATEDFVQRREAVVSTLARFSAALSERENDL